MRTFLTLPFLVVIGCGSSAPPPAEEPKTTLPEASSEVASAAPGAEAEAAEDSKLPEACAGDDASACVMPRAFVKRLCAKAYPELALHLFQKGSPWRRMYVSVKEAAPFNGLDGPSSDEKLTFDEELLVLSEKKADTGGMQVSGAGASFDLLRWDGTCVTMGADEVRRDVPPKPKHAAITWRTLEDPTQEALLKNEALAKVVQERKKECKGATMGSVSAKCEKADRAVNHLVVEAVRGGATVPVPAKVP